MSSSEDTHAHTHYSKPSQVTIFALYNYTALPIDSNCGSVERHPAPRPGSPRPSGADDRLAVGEVGQAVTPCAEDSVCQQVELKKSRCVPREERGMYACTNATNCHSLATILRE